MKKFIAFLFVLWCLNAEAQMIFRQGEYYGITTSNGTELLPAEYDKIEDTQYGSVFIVKQNHRFGIYNSDHQTFTGCRYDSAYMSSTQIIILKLNGQFGFVGGEFRHKLYRVIEPQFHAIRDMRTYEYRYENGVVTESYRPVVALKDSLWGIVDMADGRWRIQPKYKNEIASSVYFHMFRCLDGSGKMQTLIQPFTGAEFTCGRTSWIETDEAHDLLFTTDKGDVRTNPIEVIIFQYSTGRELWSYTSNAWKVQLKGHTDQLVEIVEERYDEDFKNRSYRHVFINVSNRSVLLQFDREELDEVVVTDQPSSLEVSVFTNANRSRERLHKTIYK